MQTKAAPTTRISGTATTRRSTPNEASYLDAVFDPVLSMTEVAEALGVSRATVYGLLVDSQFVTFRVGRQRRMRESALKAWIELQEQAGG